MAARAKESSRALRQRCTYGLAGSPRLSVGPQLLQAIARICFLVVIFIVTTSAARNQPADLILINGQVHTPKGWAEAVAIRDENIVMTGKDREVLRLRGPRTRVIDLHGGTVMPGLFDMHVHPMDAGLTVTKDCHLGADSSRDKILQAVAACVKAHKPGEWIVGGAYRES